jgi:magnesium transporter
MPSDSLAQRVQKIGVPAGSLVALDSKPSLPAQISIIEYNSESIVVYDDAECKDKLQNINPLNNTWIHISGTPDIELLKQIGHIFELHPLALEDILNTGQRTKLDTYPKQLFFILRTLQLHENTQNVYDQQVSIVLGSHYLLSFSSINLPLFDALRQRLVMPQNKLLSHSIDYLCYALIDNIVDYQFIALQQIDQSLTLIEERLLTPTPSKALHAIQKIKREIAIAHFAIWPLRDIIGQLIRDEFSLMSQDIKIYLHDISDHVIQAIDNIDSFREMSLGLIELYVSFTTQKLNETMKVLTVVSTLFVPLTFIASLYGMNFSHMPGREAENGFLWLIFSMCILTIAMLVFFRRYSWL